MKQKRGGNEDQIDLFSQKIDQIVEGKAQVQKKQKESKVEEKGYVIQKIQVDYCCGCGCVPEDVYIAVERGKEVPTGKSYNGVPGNTLDWDNDKASLEERMKDY